MKNFFFKCVCSVFCLTLLTSCSKPTDTFTQSTTWSSEYTTEVGTVQSTAKLTTQKPSQSTSRPTSQTTTEKQADPSFIDTLTVEQKVGQLFIVRPDALDKTQTTEEILDPKAKGIKSVSADIAAMLKKYHVGGICQFTKNISDPTQIKKFNSDLQSASEIPLFITVDEEGGKIARIANNASFKVTKYESAYAVASSNNSSDVNKMAETIGAYLKKYGFNMDFAPVADVNTNPNNPIINTRAFSSDPTVAAKMVQASTDGFRKSGILPTLKHFPGHGDTSEDSHTSLAVTYKTKEELLSCELLPFSSDKKMHAVMVGHISVPKVTGSDIPSTLSKDIIDMIPNKDSTLIITDSLEMKAITDKYSSSKSAVLAFKAGCDILLMPEDLSEAYNAILNAVQTGEISMERLDKSVKKILTYKQQFTSFDF